MFQTILDETIRETVEKLGADTKAARLFANCYPNTLETTTRKLDDGKYFVFTGDIPAMWLRDSSAQVRHYLPLAKKYPEIAEFISGLSRKQVESILQDPYANAYNEWANGKCWEHDLTDSIPLDWERKYEVDSLCYPIQLAWLLWKTCGTVSHLDESFLKMLRTITSLWKLEQHHENSPYYFIRVHCPASDTLPCNGKGNPVSYTGMTWSGFRPSDDACRYGYLIPSEMFAVVVLRYAAEISREIYHDASLAEEMDQLREEIDDGITKFGIVEHPVYGKVYAYEVDGRGNYHLMDDANVPSLMSAPYLGYCGKDDKIYRNTRKMILSHVNPYFYEGKALTGIGSPHTPPEYIWHIALSMQGLTTDDPDELQKLFDMLISSDADTGFMHEGVCKDDPAKFTRPWFAWSNSLFSEFIFHYLDVMNR